MRISLILSIIAPIIAAFGTINEPLHIGQHCEHERLSRAAFRCRPDLDISDGICFEKISLMQLAGTSGPDGYVGRGFNGAVGAPDTLDPIPEGPKAHCDNADFLDHAALGLKGQYPQSRSQATEELQTCVDHLRLRFSQGIEAADLMVDGYARILPRHVDLSGNDCIFSFTDLHLHMFARAKCSAIEGFGRALHGIQDFYAHSNWADDSTPPYSAQNPPGLARLDHPSFLDLRAENEIENEVPRALTTGCFGGIMTDGHEGQPGHPLEPGSKDCTGRITHYTMNKDHGVIDSVTGNTSKPGPNTPRSDIEGNFDRAVASAINDSRRQWRYFREELRRLYGVERGNMMICGLIRDTPDPDCYGRRIAFLQGAKSNEVDGVRITEMRIPIVHWLVSELEGNDHTDDDGEGSSKMLGSPSKHLFHDMQIPLVKATALDYIEKSRHHAAPQSRTIDFAQALTKLMANTTEDVTPEDRSAVIALVEDGDTQLIDQIDTILSLGDSKIRVHLGLSPGKAKPAGRASFRKKVKSLIKKTRSKEEALISSVLRSGGSYTRLQSPANVEAFLEHVVSRGLTHVDNAHDTATLLADGVSIADYVDPKTEPRRYNFDAQAMHNVVVSVSPMTTNLALKVSLRHVRRNEKIKDIVVGSQGNATFRATLGLDDIPRGDAWYELEIAHAAGKGGAKSGLFFVSLQSEELEMEDSNSDARDEV